MRRIAAIGIAILVAACAGPGLPTPSPGAGSPVTSLATQPSPARASPTFPPASVSVDWTALRWTAPALTAPYESITDVIAWGGGNIAVGSFQNQQGGLQAAAWLSSDWRTWTQTMLDVPAVGDSGIDRLVGLRSRLVAIGTSGEQRCIPPEGEGQVCDPAPVGIWTSAYGQHWQQVPTPSTLAGVAVDGVASNGSLLVLAGNTGWNMPGIWTSTDGTTWQPATLPAASFTDAHLAGLAAVRSGFVVTGSTGGAEPVCCVGGGGDTTPAAWFSPDGEAWQAAVVDGAAAAVGDEIGRVFVGRTGLVAWGGGNVSNGRASTDGRRWSALPALTGYPVIPQASDGTRILGQSYAAGDRVSYWTSADGRSWRQLGNAGQPNQAPAWSGPGVATADSMFLFPTGVGLVGQNGTDQFPVWFAQAVSGP